MSEWMYALRDEAVARCESEGLRPSEAAAKVLADAEADDATLAALAEVGLRYLVDKQLSAARGVGPDEVDESETRGGSRSGRWQHRPHHTEQDARWYWLSKRYATPDGGFRPILEFTAEDLAHCEGWAQVQAREHEARAEFFARCRGEVEQRQRARRVSDLPKGVVAELDALAATVLGGTP